jgi:GT2 family glycosyltransferase/glycosyltransferase involved in cell wall biosynthesis
MTLVFPKHPAPLVSIVIVVYNRAELTFECLRSIPGSKAACEVIVVDNASTDRTAELFSRIQGVKYLRNTVNVHFLQGCNQGAKLAAGSHVLLLNSDTELLPGAIDAAVERLVITPSAGAVGGRLIHPDGRLQEAGSIIWQGGVCEGYGRGDNPDLGEYLFARPVDFCSGAFLMTPRTVWNDLGGFDETFAPAYYEEVDYCTRVWRSGRSVWYDPRATILHYEFASANPVQAPSKLMSGNQRKFTARHEDGLRGRPLQHSKPAIFVRSPAQGSRKTVLICDERLPHVKTGAGYPRANRLVQSLVELEFQVTLFPILCSDADEDVTRVYEDIPREVEIPALGRHGTLGLETFLRERRGFYSTLIVSRPTTAQKIRAIMAHHPSLFEGVSMIYDAEAIFALRKIRAAENEGKTISEKEKDRLVADELAMCRGFGSVLTVSEVEASHFRKHGMTPHVVGHAISCNASATPWEQRMDVLFVGAIQEDRGPNFDAVMWFMNRVWPDLKNDLPPEARFVVAGQNCSSILTRRPLPDRVVVTGEMPSLEPVYETARIFVAPTLASAGIPLKVVEAAGHGVPVICTSLLAEQLGWDDERELSVADNPDAFLKKCLTLYANREKWIVQRDASRARAWQEYSPGIFREQVRKAITEASPV